MQGNAFCDFTLFHIITLQIYMLHSIKIILTTSHKLYNHVKPYK